MSISKKGKKLNLSLEQRKKMSEQRNRYKNHFYGKHHTIESRKKMSKSRLGKISPMKGKKKTKESLKKLSETRKRLFKEGKLVSWRKGLTKETDERIRNGAEKLSKFNKENSLFILDKNPNWRGGISFEPYGIEFNKQLKEQIRKRDNYRCQQCFRHQSELFRMTKVGRRPAKLDVHHIDFNKNNHNYDNLISLCRNCHSQTNFNREQWTQYFQDRNMGVA